MKLTGTALVFSLLAIIGLVFLGVFAFKGLNGTAQNQVSRNIHNNRQNRSNYRNSQSHYNRRDNNRSLRRGRFGHKSSILPNSKQHLEGGILGRNKGNQGDYRDQNNYRDSTPLERFSKKEDQRNLESRQQSLEHKREQERRELERKREQEQRAEAMKVKSFDAGKKPSDIKESSSTFRENSTDSNK